MRVIEKNDVNLFDSASFSTGLAMSIRIKLGIYKQIREKQREIEAVC